MATQAPQVNPKELSRKLGEKIASSGWFSVLKQPIWDSGIMDSVIDGLLADKNLGFSFTPGLKYIMKPFELCKYTDLKLVIICESPYDAMGKDPAGQEISYADGLAISSGNTMKQTLQLNEFNTAISDTIYPANDWVKHTPNTDLSYLAKQGVLLINSAMTTRVLGDAHKQLWKPFISTLIAKLDKDHEDLVFVSIGDYDWGNKDKSANYWVKREAITGKGWKHGDIFNVIERLLHKHDKKMIKW